MGFWDVTKRMIRGKPAFEVPPASPTMSGSSQQVPGQADVRHDISGNKVIPEVWVGRCKYHLDGSHMQVYAHIANTTSVPIFLDKINLINQTRELDYELQPGREWEFRIYDGPAPTNGAYTEANLYYRDNGDGDYFRARHFIEYSLADGAYCVEELHPVRPVIDT